MGVLYLHIIQAAYGAAPKRFLAKLIAPPMMSFIVHINFISAEKWRLN
jgi:hypothetical protein